MHKKNQFHLSVITLGVLAALGSGQVLAQSISTNATTRVQGNNDGSNNPLEGVEISSNLSGTVAADQAYVTVRTNGQADIVGSSQAAMYSGGNNIAVNAATGIAVNGNTGINGGVVNINTTSAGAVTIGSTANGNSTTVTGLTNINTTGGYATSIGNFADPNNTVSISGGDGVSINNNVAGTTNIGNGATSTTNIGNSAASTTNIGAYSGASAINVGNSASTVTLLGTTAINTTGTAATTIGGNSGGDVTLRSSAGSALVVGDTGTAVTGTLSSTGNFSVNTNKFTVDATTGNTAVAGTLSSVGNSTIATGASTTNTFGSGVSSSNTIGTVGDGSSNGSVNQINGATNLINGYTSSTVQSGSNNVAVTAASGTTVTGNLTANGTTNQIGASGNTSTNNVIGTTNINASVNAQTNINTGTSTGNVVMGNVANTTSLNSAFNNIGVNAYTTTNNIGTNSANVSTNNIGSINVLTTVTASGGASTLSVANGQASLTAGTTLGSNGTSGTTSGNNSGGLTVYNTAQTIGNGTTIPTAAQTNGILAGKTYQNKVNGNLFVDGNVYINGTLDYVSSNAANTAVIGSSVATSNLTGASQGTTGGTAIVMKGSATGTQTVVDANGKLTNVTNNAGTPASQSSASLTLTNGLGNVHGVVVTEAQTTLSGGQHSSSMTLNDNGATFSNSSTGAPIQVHGVADGTADFDAVNVRQFAGAIASVSAMTNIPGVDTNKTASIGVGMGSFMGKQALAFGGAYRFSQNGVIKASLATGTSGGSSRTVAGVGAGWSW